MPYILPTALLITLLTSSLPALYYYSSASSNLLTYESTTKKAAKVTSEASRQLRKSRTTMATALASTLTFAASSSLLLKDLFYPGDTTERRVYWHVELSILSVIVGVLADLYVGGFWKGALKAPFPGMTGYNDAIRSTESGLWWSRNIIMGWGVYAVYALTFQVQV